MKHAAFGLIASLAIPTLPSSAAPQAAQTFTKDAAQFCLSKLDARRQSELYSRILNIGASYTHGCTMCDTNKAFRAWVDAAGDAIFIRRNYLARFLGLAPFKDKREFSFELVSVTENDPIHDLSKLFTRDALKANPYDGRWVWRPDADTATRMDAATRERIAASPGFKDESALVGVDAERPPRRRKGERHGHIYQTVPGAFAAEGARQKTVFDFAMDRTRAPEIMKFHGDAILYKQLLKAKWNNPAKREALIAKTVQRLQETDPGIVFGVDLLFWDSVPLLFRFARDANPKSLVTRLISTRVFGRIIALEQYDDAMLERMMDDLYEVLGRVSTGANGRKPVPVLVGRFIDEPGRYIVSNDLQSEFGALIGLFVEVFTGRDFTKEMTEWLERISYEEPSPSTASLAMGTSRKPRLGAYTDPETGVALSVDDVARLRSQFEAAHARAGALLADQGYTWDDLRSEMDRVGGTEDATLLGEPKPALPWALRGAVNAAILDALEDLPLLVKSADKAFAWHNRKLRSFAARTDNNVHVVNADEFYENFYKVVNPRTMHPSVEGATWMARMVESSVCASQGPN